MIFIKWIIRRVIQVVVGFTALISLCGSPVSAQDHELPQVLPIDEFIVRAAKNDLVFEEILIDALKVRYQKALNLPVGDLVLSVKSLHAFLLSRDDNNTDLGVGLSKLFPLSGTEISVYYSNSPSLSTGNMRSDFHAMISQPIARNAFGRGARLQDQIIGIEMELMRYQIVEAYEDYLASLMAAYYDWYSIYENLKISRSSLQANKKLLENMLERAEQRIALPVDVNKVKLLVLAKEELLLQTQEAYDHLTREIQRAIRHDNNNLQPADPFGYHTVELDLKNDYQAFVESSRTYEIFNLLEQKTSITVDKSIDDLLPSTDLLIGYRSESDQWQMRNDDNLVYAGVSLEWPFLNDAAKARYEVSRIDQRQQTLANQNKNIQLYTDIKNIYSRIQREKMLIKLTEQRIALAESVLEDETRNYSYGKVSLNDYIDAVNKLDEYRFQKTSHAVLLHQLITEALRLTDRLVGKNVIEDFDPAEN
jgi:outer membrane protein TolC